MRPLAVTLACIALAAIPASIVAQQRKCGETKTPKRLPAPSALIDSARAMAELAPLGVPREGIVFSLLFLETDSLPRVRLLEVADVEALEVFGANLRPQHPAGIWAVRVRVRGGPTPGLTVERSTYCPPVLTQTSFARTYVRADVRPGDQMRTSSRPIRLLVEVEVAETGEVLVARLDQSTGLRDVDDEITGQWRRRRFLPALVDGMPIRASYRTDGRSPKM